VKGSILFGFKAAAVRTATKYCLSLHLFGFYATAVHTAPT
jgi:hypothetical protein